MAVSINFEGVFKFLKDAYNCFSSPIGYIISVDDNVNSFKTEMRKLSASKKVIEGKCRTVKLQGMKHKPQVESWLKEVRRLEEEENSFGNYNEGCLGPCNVRSRYNVSRNSEKLCVQVMDLDLMASGKDFENVVDDEVPPIFIKQQDIPSTVGMDSVYRKLEEFVKAGPIIGIYGMGGVGKTTLLKRFNNDFFINTTDIDVVIFVEAMSTDLNVEEEIQKSIYTRLMLPWKVEETQNERATAIGTALSQNKFILFLDNLWDRLDFKKVGIPVPTMQSNSKIIVTSRIEDVCDRMDVKKKMKMECLSWKDSWSLFKEKLDEWPFFDRQIQSQARTLARNCGGLPLALITVARCMRSKKTLGEWEHAINNITSKPSDFPGIEEHVLIPLKQSYDKLPNDAPKACVLYFTLWRNKKVDERYLTNYWMSEGLIDDFEDWKDARHKESHILGIVRAASLLETAPDKSFVGLHPMVRAMALWVAGGCGKQPNRWLVTYSNNLVKWRGAERICLRNEKLSTLPESPDCPILVSIMVKGCRTLEKIPNGFFQFMPCLRVLDLSYTPIDDLPPGIGNLVGLQLLELQGTNITCLPQELKLLVKLKFLGLNWTRRLKAIPHGVIGGLGELLVFESYCSFCQWKVESTLGPCFTELESLKKLTRLTLTVGSYDVLQWLCESNPVAAAVKELCIQKCEGQLATMHLSSPTLLSNIKCLNTLHLLDLDLKELFLGCSSSEEESSDADACIRDLIIEELHRTKIIWRRLCLKNLSKLSVIKCNQIEVLLHYEDDSSTQLHEEGSRPVIRAFPSLKVLKVVSLPKLKSLSDGWILSFPMLETIVVNRCPELNKLSLVAKKLREFKCQKSWWDQLEWEDRRPENTFRLIGI